MALEYKIKQVKVNRVVPRECTGQSKYPLPTTQEKTTHGHHQMVNTEIRLIIFSVVTDGEALYSQQKQDQELTVAQIMKSLLPNSDLKKVGKTTRPFRYDLNQVPYDYTVEVAYRFKRLDLINRRTVDRGAQHYTGGSDQDHPQEKEIQKGKMVV